MVLVWVGGDRSLSILPSPPHTLPTGVIQLGTPKCPCNTHSPQGSAGTHTCIPHTYIASSPPHCPLLSKPLTPRLTFILFSPKEALLNFDKQNSSWVKGCQVWDCHTAADREPVRGIALRREEQTRGSVTCPHSIPWESADWTWVSGEPQTLVKKSWRRIWSIEGRSWGDARRMAARSCRAGRERLAGRA